jgi:hypothetical protein
MTEKRAKECLGRGTGLTVEEKSKRNRKICVAWIDGSNRKTIAETYQLTRPTINEILRRYAHDCGAKWPEEGYRLLRWGYSMLSRPEKTAFETKVEGLRKKHFLYKWFEDGIQDRKDLLFREQERAEKERFRREHPDAWKEKERQARIRDEARYAANFGGTDMRKAPINEASQ